MSDNYFVLQANEPLEPEQPWFNIPGLKTQMMTDLGMLPPTPASVAHGLLEWLVPNTQYNQGWISMHYQHFKILAAGKERVGTDEVPRMEGMPEPLTVEDIENMPEGPGKITPKLTEIKKSPEKTSGDELFNVPTDPSKIKALKAKLTEKLSELEVKAPKNSTLKTLQKLLKAKL